MKGGKAWVGDEVHDEDAGRTGMVTDVSGGTYFLRPLTGGGTGWTQNDPERLTVTVPLDTGRSK
ncbi:hypothetical protein ACOT81_45455 [Streptomyces sp. WI04-05B]|uniref:hypothetical protein n=1 Tax=Streptomyces TaxID=1883 RepID=UPI0029A01862|nr:MULTISPECIES: hypothetical protein [unclassified Streptomyces]MDX2548979.1 hypothetical protein [Streptomyces sp. WI04-05B]MDX2587662.1 hypothetical protein [Streptomyces sp. WI04-05A]MDX3746674.1 hypothetical protein [Streptomyces sp. AK08-02]